MINIHNKYKCYCYKVNNLQNKQVCIILRSLNYLHMQIIKSINNEGNPKRDISDIQSVIIHHTGIDNGDSHNYLNRTDYISAHFLIKKSGEVVQLMDLDVIAYHAGASSWKGLPSYGNSLNFCTIGIEVEGYKQYTDPQRASTKELVLELMNEFKIPSDLILRHKDISPGRKIDIDDNFFNNQYGSWEEYQKDLQFNLVAMSKYIEIMEQEVPEGERVFKSYEGEEGLCEKDVKALISIAMYRTKQELK